MRDWLDECAIICSWWQLLGNTPDSEPATEAAATKLLELDPEHKFPGYEADAKTLTNWYFQALASGHA